MGLVRLRESGVEGQSTHTTQSQSVQCNGFNDLPQEPSGLNGRGKNAQNEGGEKGSSNSGSSWTGVRCTGPFLLRDASPGGQTEGLVPSTGVGLSRVSAAGFQFRG